MAKKVNMTLVNKQLSRSKIFQSAMRKTVIKTVDSSKRRLIQEFSQHPVTREIEGGASSPNISGTLGGYGNLFTFIGFLAGTTPTLNVRRMLETIRLENAKMGKASRKKVSIDIGVNMPSKGSFSAATPLPFGGGRSWLYGIEEGISGFGSYMYKKWKTSRSGHGIQTQKKIRSGGFKNTSYFSSMLLGFTKRIR